jgi:hypothetical protein
VIESGDQLVDAIDKAGDIRGDRGLILRLRMPGASSSCQYCCSALSWRCWPSRRAAFCSSGLKTVASFHRAAFDRFRSAGCRQQAVALHAQRTGFVNGVRAALYAVHQASGDRHAGDADGRAARLTPVD